MFKRTRAKVALLRAKRLLRSARKENAQANAYMMQLGEGPSRMMSPTGLKYLNSANAKKSKAYELVWKSRKLRGKKMPE